MEIEGSTPSASAVSFFPDTSKTFGCAWCHSYAHSLDDRKRPKKESFTFFLITINKSATINKWQGNEHTRTKVIATLREADTASQRYRLLEVTVPTSNSRYQTQPNEM